MSGLSNALDSVARHFDWADTDIQRIDHLIGALQNVVHYLPENPPERGEAIEDIAFVIAGLQELVGGQRGSLEASKTLLDLLNVRRERLANRVEQTTQNLMRLRTAHARASRPSCTDRLKRALIRVVPMVCAGTFAAIAASLT